MSEQDERNSSNHRIECLSKYDLFRGTRFQFVVYLESSCSQCVCRDDGAYVRESATLAQSNSGVSHVRVTLCIAFAPMTRCTKKLVEAVTHGVSCVRLWN